MVIKHLVKLLFFLWIGFFSFPLSSGEVKVEAQVDQDTIWEDQPFQILITITHEDKDQIDDKSFKIASKVLEIEKVKDVKIADSSKLMVSYYRLKLEGQPKGIYILPIISVKIAGKNYTSTASTYKVGELSVGKTANKSYLHLAPLLDIQSIYPGSRFKVGYRYLFNDDIELTKEILPLLDGEGFLKVGAKEVTDDQNNQESTRTITQILEAVKPGEYHFEPAHLSGLVYREDRSKKRTYIKPALQASTPFTVLTVLPFPKKGMPASFNGAIGPFTAFKVSLPSGPKINFGETITLIVEMTGTTQLENTPLPQLCCQPGWSGIFQLSDLPPQEEIKENTKKFKLELRALIATIQAIPPIEFSFFMPDSHSYQLLKSNPIPISMIVLAKKEPIKPEKPQTKTKQPAASFISTKPKPLEINAAIPLTISDLQPLFLSRANQLWLIPASLVLLLFQFYLKSYWQRQPLVKKKNSLEIFTQALQKGLDSNLFYSLLNQAFLLRLLEKNHLAAPMTLIEELPEQGISQEVKQFLSRIEEKRFTGRGKELDSLLLEEATTLFNQI